MGEGFKSMSDENLPDLWNELAEVSTRYMDDFFADAKGLRSEKLTRDEVIWRLRERRDLRQEFMAACGETDDGYINQAEAKFLRESEFVFEVVAVLRDVTDEEIDAAELPFRTKSGRRTAVPPTLDI